MKNHMQTSELQQIGVKFCCLSGGQTRHVWFYFKVSFTKYWKYRRYSFVKQALKKYSDEYKCSQMLLQPSQIGLKGI